MMMCNVGGIDWCTVMIILLVRGYDVWVILHFWGEDLANKFVQNHDF